ncbi:MAG: hypothetical protein WED82_01375 [Balneolales bacterium]
MSWDVSIIKFSKTYSAVDEIPEDEQPLPLGSIDSVHEAVLEFFPTTDWTDPAWGIFDSKYGSIEFNLGNDDPATSMMLHVRASNEIVFPIVELCRKYNWAALDCTSGDILNSSETPEKGLVTWRKYLSHILGK